MIVDFEKHIFEHEVIGIRHGVLSYLLNDDHTQYHTDSRALTWLATRSTTDLPEGTNLYYTDVRARAAISETITGIDYNNTSGVFSLTSGYVIPTTTEESNWNTAYGWGNHAVAGYLTSIAGIDHGVLGGLTDDDHSIYALLAGRAGGQVLIGGINSGDGLTLQSTSHGTKGSILFGTSVYDEVNNYLGIGCTPNAKLTVGAALGGTAQSTTISSHAGALGTTAGNELALASFGCTVGNYFFCGVRAYRVANGSDWQTTAISIGMDVDNTVRSGASIWLHDNGEIGFNTSATGYRLMVISDTSANQLLLKSTGAGNHSHIWVDNAAGGNQCMVNFMDAGVAKWQFGKQTSNEFLIYNAVTSDTNLMIDATGNITLNQSSKDCNFSVNGDTIADLLFVDAGTDRIGLGGVTAPTAKLHIDQSSTTGAIPVLTVDQADVSEEFIRFIGTSANGVLTQSIVEHADVTTATVAGWLKIYVQDDGNQLTDQAYYVPIYTLS